MGPAEIGGLLSGGIGLAKTIMGINQSKESLPKLPKYDIPPEVERELQMYENLSYLLLSFYLNDFSVSFLR